MPGIMPKSDAQKSYQKALYLAIAFVVVLVIANSLVKVVSHSMNSLKANSGPANPNIVVFDEKDKDPIKKRIAGFWRCGGAKSPAFPFLRVSDRIELKDNGIFWRVKHTTIVLPSGDSAAFSMVMTGYANPYSKSRSDSDSMSFQVHFIGQVLISGKDTCYVEHARMSNDPKKSVMPDILRTPQRQQDEGVVDTVWDIVANGEVFDFEGISYSKYDTAGPGLGSFFPAGATKLVGRISVPECSNSLSLENVTKQALTGSFAALSVPSRTQEDVHKAVSTYYQKMFAQDLARRVTVYGTGSVTMSFAVNSRGNVTDPKIIEEKPLNMKLSADLKNELSTWIFPSCTSQKAPLNVTFSFTY
jgi:hypothetical protein